MNLNRLFISLITAAILAGLVLLVQLCVTLVSEGPLNYSNVLTNLRQSPLAWSYGLLSAIVSFGALIWIVLRLPDWRLRFEYRHVESRDLDEDPRLTRAFYRAMLAFRCRYGEKHFARAVLAYFDFDHDYHNQALHWIDQVVSGLDQNAVPVEMMLDSLCEGHIGRVFSNCRYSGGLTTLMFTPDQPVYLLATPCSLELWSASSSAAICRLDRQSLELENTKQSHTLRLTGLDTAADRTREIFLSLPDTVQSETLKHWLAPDKSTRKLSEQQNFGIAVDEIAPETDHPAPAANNKLHDLLMQLLGSHLDAVFAQDTLTISGLAQRPSAIVLCSGLGIVVVHEVSAPGTLFYSGAKHWAVFDETGTELVFDNACITAQREAEAVTLRLASASLTDWPVHALVVCSHTQSQPERRLDGQIPQTDVVNLQQLPGWFAARSMNPHFRFSKDDYNTFISLLDPARLASKATPRNIKNV